MKKLLLISMLFLSGCSFGISGYEHRGVSLNTSFGKQKTTVIIKEKKYINREGVNNDDARKRADKILHSLDDD